MRVRCCHRSAWFSTALVLLAVAAMAGQRTYKHNPNNDNRRLKFGKASRWSPDHTLRAIVIYLKPRSYGEAESKVEIRSASGSLLAHSDYTSQYGNQGGTITGAAWTADSRFFVYQRESSGGHSAWHYSISFYSRQRHKIYSLDRALDRLLSSHGSNAGDGAITGGLELFKPCTLKTQGRVNIPVPGVRVRLLKRPEDGLQENALTIDLGRLESVLTAKDEE